MSYFPLILITTIIVTAGVAQAGEVDVTNNVTVVAETGDNHGGNVQEGNATVNVEVEQTIDGVSLPPVKVSTSSSGGSAYAEVNVKTVGATTTVTTKVSTENTPEEIQNAVDQEGAAPAVSPPPVEVAGVGQSMSLWGSITGALGTVATALGHFYGLIINFFS